MMQAIQEQGGGVAITMGVFQTSKFIITESSSEILVIQNSRIYLPEGGADRIHTTRCIYSPATATLAWLIRAPLQRE